MPKYSVLVTSDATVSAYVDVVARNPREAERKALSEARDNPGEYKWEWDEGNELDPYLCDPGNCAELVDHDDVSG